MVVTLAFRNRIMFKLGVRNIPKRPAQTALIVLGLMLSTVLITAAFSTGDTLVYTIRSVAVDALGNTDEIITVPNAETAPNSGYFDDALVDQVSEDLSGAPCRRDSAGDPGAGPTVQSPDKMLSAPSVTLFAPGPQYAEYTSLTTTEGDDVSLEDLASTEGDIQVFIDENTAEDLKAEIGDRLYLYVGAEPRPLKVAGIVEGASSGNFVVCPDASRERAVHPEQAGTDQRHLHLQHRRSAGRSQVQP